MKRIMYGVLVLLMLALFAWSCASTPKEKPAEAKPAQAEKAAADAPVQAAKPVAAGAVLADVRAAKQLACDACHGTGGAVVDDNEQPVSSNCIKCHGSLSDVGKKAAGHINPHKSHLGEINCTACHAGHAASKAYCLN